MSGIVLFCTFLANPYGWRLGHLTRLANTRMCQTRVPGPRLNGPYTSKNRHKRCTTEVRYEGVHVRYGGWHGGCMVHGAVRVHGACTWVQYGYTGTCTWVCIWPFWLFLAKPLNILPVIGQIARNTPNIPENTPKMASKWPQNALKPARNGLRLAKIWLKYA